MRRSLLIAFMAAALLLSGCTRTANRFFDLRPLEYRVEVDKDVMVPMSDGVELAADLYRPVGLARSPVILVRTPYGKQTEGYNGMMMLVVYKLLARHGYTVVVQDCRGRYKSGGDFYPFAAESKDGHDTLKWAATQPWSDGRVGSWGGSYFGYTQWTMADDAPELKAMVPIVTSADIWCTFYEGGAINLENMLGWSTTNAGREGVPPDADALTAAIIHLPLINADDLVNGKTVPFWDDVVSLQEMDRHPEFSYGDRFERVSAPMLSIAGWYDLFQKYQIEDMATLRKSGMEPARSQSMLVIGPWGHGIFKDPPVKFKDGSILDLAQFQRVLDFYDMHLKGMETGAGHWHAYRVYVMGANEWREFDEWPPPGMKPTAYYFGSNGRANTASGDGSLSLSPASGDPDQFTYDPANPVRTAGGPLLGPDLGPKLQATTEARDDVLVYTSDPLASPLTVMGPVKVTLFAATDGPDTDFTAKLCDVFPDGKSVNIVDGIIRARFRNGDLSRPEMVEPGKVYEYDIDLWHTAYKFQPGHRIRVQISSSNFPRFDRNLNTGGDLGTGTEMRKANQEIFHDGERESRIVLPVIK